MNKRKAENEHVGDAVADTTAPRSSPPDDVLDVNEINEWLTIDGEQGRKWTFNLGNRRVRRFDELEQEPVIQELLSSRPPYSVVFRECQHLRMLPVWLSQIRSLKKIKIVRCPMLRSCDVVDGQATINMISVVDCGEFRQFSINVMDLGVHSLHLTNCPNFDFEHLATVLDLSTKNLSDLVLTNFSTPTLFPYDLQLDRLCSLSVKECPNVTVVAHMIHKWRKLTDLVVAECPKLRTISPLNKKLHLTSLTIDDCPDLDLTQTLHQHINSARLEYLWLHHSMITELPFDLRRFLKLEHLSFYGCEQLRHLPTCIGNLTRLDNLTIVDCPQLDIEAVCLPPKMTSLELENLDCLISLRNLIDSDRILRRLVITKCKNLKVLPDSIPEKCDFTLEDCPSIQSITMPPRAGSIYWIYGCPSVTWMSHAVQEKMSPACEDFYDRIPVADVLSDKNFSEGTLFSLLPRDIIQHCIEPFFQGDSFVKFHLAADNFLNELEA